MKEDSEAIVYLMLFPCQHQTATAGDGQVVEGKEMLIQQDGLIQTAQLKAGIGLKGRLDGHRTANISTKTYPEVTTRILCLFKVRQAPNPPWYVNFDAIIYHVWQHQDLNLGTWFRSPGGHPKQASRHPPVGMEGAMHSERTPFCFDSSQEGSLPRCQKLHRILCEPFHCTQNRIYDE